MSVHGAPGSLIQIKGRLDAARRVADRRNYEDIGATLRHMRRSDVICSECGAGYRRIELETRPGKQGEFRCRVCNHLLE
jgi:DNA polymerase II large subunit